MFSKELENLIQATLEDGVLEPYELESLQKRAKAEGVDLTELEIYINSLLQKRNRELKEKEAAAQQQADEKRKAEMQAQVKEAKEKETANLKALGYKECPKCHKQVSPMTLVCECGFEFTENKNNKSVQSFFENFNSITLTDAEMEMFTTVVNGNVVREDHKIKIALVEKQVNFISTFPVPNTKSDIIEFLSTSVALANKKLGFLDTKKGFLIACVIGGLLTCGIGLLYGLMFYTLKPFAEEKLKNAWFAKCEQVLLKGHSLRGDAEFSQQLDYYENLLNKK